MKHKYTILYVDDEISNLKTFNYLLRREYNIITASSGDEGLNILAKQHVDLIVSDQRMPGMSGVEFLEQVAKKYPDPNRILLTGFSDFDAMRSAINKGKIFQYVQKPWEIEDFKPIIDRAIEAYYLKQENDRLKKDLIDKNRGLTESNSQLKIEIARNIENLKKIEQSQEDVKKSEERLKLATSAANIGVWDWDVRDNHLFWDVSMYHLFDLDEKDYESPQEAWFGVLHPECREEAENAVNKSLKGENYDWEFKIITPQNKLKFIRAVAATYFDAEGQPTRMVGVNFDITDKKLIENEILGLNTELEKRVESRTLALKESEEKFRELSELLPQAIFEINMDFQLTYLNNYGCKITGYSKQDFDKGVNIKQLIALKDDERFERFLSQNADKYAELSNEYTLVSKAGAEMPVLVYMAPIVRNNIKTGLRGIIINIQNRKKAEEEIRKLSRAIVQSPVAVMITDVGGCIEYVNPKFTENTGFTYDEVIGKKLNSVYHSERFFQKLLETISNGQPWQGEICNKRKNGDFYWESASISPLTDQFGNITHYVAVMEDVTKRKHMEEELKVAKAQADDANRAKSEFLANMSHEIRTPMNSIMGFSELLSKMVEDKKQASYLSTIQSSSKTLLTLINDILDLSKIEARRMELNYSVIDVKALLLEMESFFSIKRSKKGLHFNIDIDPLFPKYIRTDEVRLRQVILNLLSNAFKFTDKGAVTLRGIVKSQNKISEAQQLNSLIIEVEDTGIGIPKSEQERIFETFTQKEGQNVKKYGGTGLGLSISRKLIELMNGELKLISTAGKGSTFRVILDNVEVVSDNSQSHESTLNPDTFLFNNSHILIVDNNEDNLKYTQGILESRNLQMSAVNSGMSALELMKNKRPDLIITDLKMPVMDGFELMKHITKDQKLANIPVIAASASVVKGVEDRVMQNGFAAFLPKPYSVDSLLLELSKFLPYTQLTEEYESDLIVPDAASDVFVDDVEEVLSALDELEQLYQPLKIRQPMNMVNVFAIQCMSVGQKFKLSSLINFGNSLQLATEVIDIEKMLSLIDKFPGLNKSIREVIISK